MRKQMGAKHCIDSAYYPIRHELLILTSLLAPVNICPRVWKLCVQWRKLKQERSHFMPKIRSVSTETWSRTDRQTGDANTTPGGGGG